MPATGTVLAEVRASIKSNPRHRALPPLELTKSWSCTKRDGSVVPFDAGKISSALTRCFDSINYADSFDDGKRRQRIMIDELVSGVVNTLLARKLTKPGVEEVQQHVIQQLWAKGLFEAGEHYQNYREERRKYREMARVTPLQERIVSEDAKHFPSALQYFQFIDKYARWNERYSRRETWRECCNRVMTYLRKQPQLKPITESEWMGLDAMLFEHKASTSMRVVQMAGPSLDRCPSGAFNCCYVACDNLLAFSEALYLLMQGCGVGYSVESDYVEMLPRIQRQHGGTPSVFTVPDATEGWCEALRIGIAAWVSGNDVAYEFHLIRKEGERLKTKGGRASGPEPLRHLLKFARDLFLRRQGRYLTPSDCHDLMCVLGKIVQVGGVRRSSEISLSDLGDTEMRDRKSGNWYDRCPWLDMANNSAVYECKPEMTVFMEEWLALAKSGSGERGIFNRGGTAQQIPDRRTLQRFGLNPCGEVLLRSCQMCNLSIVIARPDDTVETLEQKVIAATYFGTLQSTLTNFKYVRPIWQQNCDEERLLGVDITGQMDCPLLRPGAPGREQLLEHLRQIVLEINAKLAARLGIPVSAATTVVKPSGNSAEFFACSSGLHTRWSKYKIRRVRVSRHGPIAALLVSEGVPYAVDPLNSSLLVFDFLPAPAPDGTPTRNDMTAVEQFQNWLVWKTHWTEHNPSATIYVGPDEWLELGHEVYKHFDKVGGLTFLPRDSGTYQLTPNEEITEEEYKKRLEAFPAIRWARLAVFEQEDNTAPIAEPACSGGGCERL